MLEVLDRNCQLDRISKSKIAPLTSSLVTAREREVLKKMSEGLTVKEIAACLFVSCHTIISHKKNLIVKLDARNSIDLTVKAIKHGLISI